jgi:hypothetical protein
VNELIKKNEQFLDEFKNSIIQNQENNNIFGLSIVPGFFKV